MENVPQDSKEIDQKAGSNGVIRSIQEMIHRGEILAKNLDADWPGFKIASQKFILWKYACFSTLKSIGLPSQLLNIFGYTKISYQFPDQKRRALIDEIYGKLIFLIDLANDVSFYFTPSDQRKNIGSSDKPIQPGQEGFTEGIKENGKKYPLNNRRFSIGSRDPNDVILNINQVSIAFTFRGDSKSPDYFKAAEYGLNLNQLELLKKFSESSSSGVRLAKSTASQLRAKLKLILDTNIDLLPANRTGEKGYYKLSIECKVTK